MPVFDRIRLVVKFRHRSLQWYRSHRKIFLELGNTAPQSWVNFGNFRNYRFLVADFKRKIDQKMFTKAISIVYFSHFRIAIRLFSTRDIRAEGSPGLHIRWAWSYIPKSVTTFLFFENFDFFILFGWILVGWPLKFRSKPQNVITFEPILGWWFSKIPSKKYENIKIFKKQKNCHAFRYIRSCSPNMKPW